MWTRGTSKETSSPKPLKQNLMFGDLTTKEQRMNQDSADWFDDEFGKPETGIETFAAFLGFVFVIGLMVLLLW